MTPVLVVENDPAIRKMLQMMLDLEGYRVRAAADGPTGLDLLRTSDEPHVVLVNHLMPDVDGPAVLSAAVADPVLWRHSYVLMSSCPTCHARPSLSVPHGLLEKPFTVDQLLTTIEAAADGLVGGAGSDGAAAQRMGASYAPHARAEGIRAPLLLAFGAMSAISRRRGRIVVRTRPGATVEIAVRDASGQELWRAELSGARVADARGYCRWRWIHRARGGELTVEARAEWGGQQASVARSFALGQPLYR